MKESRKACNHPQSSKQNPPAKSQDKKNKPFTFKTVVKKPKNKADDSLASKKAEPSKDKVKKEAQIAYKENVVTDEEIFAEDMYKKMIAELEREEEEKAKQEREEKLKVEEEARRADEPKDTQQVEKPKDELSEEELRELEIARKIEVLLKRLSKDSDLKNFLLQYSEGELQELLGLDSVMMSFFSEKNYPDFYRSKLKDSKFTPYIDVAEFSLKHRMNLGDENASLAGSEIDWEFFRALYLRMKQHEDRRTKGLEADTGVIRNVGLDNPQEIDVKDYSEEVLAGNADLLKDTDPMDVVKRFMLLKEQLNAVASLMNKHNRQIENETTPVAYNKTLRKVQLRQQEEAINLPELARKYRVNMSLIERRKYLTELEVLERRYRILNNEPV
eukprot:TRINITY_DN2005_c0_g1_i7.p1 TRINITY_DN2005_c0_g1~~TRINITY_DN2005_c0_g1_i7.p1  ORF type:complete len:388 (-),score=174.05 TRINITY_DN2005_c0_g1_i7:77-1240(-)